MSSPAVLADSNDLGGPASVEVAFAHGDHERVWQQLAEAAYILRALGIPFTD